MTDDPQTTNDKKNLGAVSATEADAVSCSVLADQLTHAVNDKLIALYDAIAHTAGVSREIAVAETGYFVHALVVAMIQNAPQWQSIETAPKDGTRILVTVKGMADSTSLVCGNYAREQFTSWDGSRFGYTHWMPLPSPPTEEK